MEFGRYQNSNTNINNIAVVIDGDKDDHDDHDDDDDDDDDEDIGEIDDDFFKQLDAETEAKVKPSLSKETKQLLLAHIPPILISNSMNLISEHATTSGNASQIRDSGDEGEIIESINKNNENYRNYDNFHAKYKSSASSSSSSSHKRTNQYNRNNSNEYLDRNENANRSSKNSPNHSVELKRRRHTTFPSTNAETPIVVIYDQQIIPEPIDDPFIYEKKFNQRNAAASTHEKIIQKNSTIPVTSNYENYDINPKALAFLKNITPNANVIDKKKSPDLPKTKFMKDISNKKQNSGKMGSSLSKKQIDAMSKQLMVNAVNRVRQSLTLIEGNEKNIRLLRYLYTCCTNPAINSTINDNRNSIVQSNKNLPFKYSTKLNIYSDDDDGDDDDDDDDDHIDDDGKDVNRKKEMTEDDNGIDIVTENTKKFIKLFGFDYLLIKNKLKLMRSALLKKDQTENGEIPEINDEDLSEATFIDDALDDLEYNVLSADDNDNESVAAAATTDIAIVDVDKKKRIDRTSEEDSSQQRKTPIEMLRKQITVNLLPKLTITQLNAIIDFSNIIQSLPKNKNDMKFVYDNLKDIIDYICYENNELNMESTSTTKRQRPPTKALTDINNITMSTNNSSENIATDIQPITTMATATSTITTTTTTTKSHDYFDDGHISDTLSLNASIHSDDEDRRTQQEIEGIRKQLSLKDDEFRKKQQSILNLEKQKKKKTIELYSDHNNDNNIDDEDDLDSCYYRGNTIYEGERLFSTSLDRRRRRPSSTHHNNNRFNSPGGSYNNRS